MKNNIKNKTNRELALQRMSLSCQVGCDALNDKNPDITDSEDQIRYALYNLLQAVIDLTIALREP